MRMRQITLACKHRRNSVIEKNGLRGLSTTNIFPKTSNIQNFKRISERLFTIFNLLLHYSLQFSVKQGEKYFECLKSTIFQWYMSMFYTVFSNSKYSVAMIIYHHVNWQAIWQTLRRPHIGSYATS